MAEVGRDAYIVFVWKVEDRWLAAWHRLLFVPHSLTLWNLNPSLGVPTYFLPEEKTQILCILLGNILRCFQEVFFGHSSPQGSLTLL